MLAIVLIWAALGAIVGLIASPFMKDHLRRYWCVIIGVDGAVIFGVIAGVLRIGGSAIVNFLIAIGGACLLLLIVRLLRRQNP